MTIMQTEKILTSAMRSLSYRAHSVAELKKKLINKGMDGEVVESVIEGLKSSGFLDDRDFAEKYLEYALVRKSWGIARVRGELMKRGVSTEIIDEVTSDSEVSDMELKGAKGFVEKKMRTLQDPVPDIRAKMIKRLKDRGYGWDVIGEVTNDL